MELYSERKSNNHRRKINHRISMKSQRMERIHTDNMNPWTKKEKEPARISFAGMATPYRHIKCKTKILSGEATYITSLCSKISITCISR